MTYFGTDGLFQAGTSDPSLLQNAALGPKAYGNVWVVKIPYTTVKGQHNRLLGVYTTETLAWEAIASAYRRDHYRQFELVPERVALDAWLGD